MSYDHCPRCGNYDSTEVRHTGYGSTIYQCEDCGFEFEIDDDMYGNNSSWGWQSAVDEDTRRIWLKTLWWYIHLSWQGSAASTFEVLKDNGIDNINKLIETPGRGYRLPLFRRMMLEYYRTGPHKVKDFAAFTKLNNAKCVSVEPELTSGGVAAYAQSLLAEVSTRKEEAYVNSGN